MSIEDKLNGLKDKLLELKIKRKIKRLEKLSNQHNDDYNVLGYHVDEDPKKYETYKIGDENNFDLELRCFYNDYISKGTKMVYGIEYSTDGVAGNHGSYYYVDDDSYIYEFFKYIKDKEYDNDYDLFSYILEFLRDYYGYIKQLDRSEMFKLLSDKNNRYFKLNKEHSIKDFKGKGNAMCSEFSIMAQNILRCLNYESYIMIGNLRVGDSDAESHAFNLINFTESDTGEEKSAILDFSNYVIVYDLKFNKLGEMPFVGYIDVLDEKTIQELVSGERHLIYDDYAYYIIGDSMMKLDYERERDYYIDNYIKPNKQVANNDQYIKKI